MVSWLVLVTACLWLGVITRESARVDPPAEAAENFRDAPVSLTEARSARDQSAAPLTPRDVLVKALRQLDSGEISPDTLIVVFSERGTDDTVLCSVRRSGARLYEQIGLLHTAAFDLLSACST
jgi:hypothetical protein